MYSHVHPCTGRVSFKRFYRDTEKQRGRFKFMGRRSSDGCGCCYTGYSGAEIDRAIVRDKKVQATVHGKVPSTVETNFTSLRRLFFQIPDLSSPPSCRWIPYLTLWRPRRSMVPRSFRFFSGLPQHLAVKVSRRKENLSFSFYIRSSFIRSKGVMVKINRKRFYRTNRQADTRRGKRKMENSFIVFQCGVLELPVHCVEAIDLRFY